jgi:hypothetical protein
MAHRLYVSSAPVGATVLAETAVGDVNPWASLARRRFG